MAKRSFRDRFYSPSVSRALTSPSGILALGAGAALGLIATVGTAGLAAPVIGAVVGGALGYGGRVALAIPRDGTDEKIDPRAVNEPWRRAVQDAQQARNRFNDAVNTFRDGPLRDAMTTMAGQLDEAVSECWQVAQQGQLVADARKRINDREANWELQQALHAVGDDREPNETQARTINALRSQLATAARMDALIASTRDELALINARLDESVTRAIELSVSNRTSDASLLGTDIGEIVDDLESLRMAIEDVDGRSSSSSSSSSQLPPPPLPPPLPGTDQGGRGQTSPGT